MRGRVAQPGHSKRYLNTLQLVGLRRGLASFFMFLYWCRKAYTASMPLTCKALLVLPWQSSMLPISILYDINCMML